MDIKCERLIASGIGSSHSYSRIAIHKLRQSMEIEQIAERQSKAYSTLRSRGRRSAAAAAAQRMQNATDSGGGGGSGPEAILAGEQQNSQHEKSNESAALAAIILQKQQAMLTANGIALSAESEIWRRTAICVICRQQQLDECCMRCCISNVTSNNSAEVAIGATTSGVQYMQQNRGCNKRVVETKSRAAAAAHSSRDGQCMHDEEAPEMNSTRAEALTTKRATGAAEAAEAVSAAKCAVAQQTHGCGSCSFSDNASGVASCARQNALGASAFLHNETRAPHNLQAATSQKALHEQQRAQLPAELVCCCCSKLLAARRCATTCSSGVQEAATSVLTTNTSTKTTSSNASQLIQTAGPAAATKTTTATKLSSPTTTTTTTSPTTKSQISFKSAIALTAGTNFITHQHQNQMQQTTTTIPTATTTTPYTNISAPLRSALQILQLLLFLCIQMQFLRPIYKKIHSFLYKNNSNLINSNSNNNYKTNNSNNKIAYTTNSNSSNSRNSSDNSYINMKFNKRQQKQTQQQQQEKPELLGSDDEQQQQQQQLWPSQQKQQPHQQQQQRPPLIRLMKLIRCNSYYNNYNNDNANDNDNDNNNSNVNNSNNNATNLYNASQQQKLQLNYANFNANNNNNKNSFNNSKLFNNIHNNNNNSNNKCSQLQLQPHIHHNQHHQIVQQQSQQQPQQKHYCNLMQQISSSTSSLTTSHQNLVQQQQQQQKHLKPNNIASSLQLQLQQMRYFKMPNLSFLYIILIIISFLSLFLPSTNAQISNAIATAATSAPSSASSASSALSAPVEDNVIHTLPVSLTRNETVCRSLDIRNSPASLKQLRNCTVIEGFLLITLMNQHKVEEFTESFPLLTEVTEFIIVYRVHHLRSLSQLFPNLSVIRGTTLFEGYALIVYYNPHLEDLGLGHLTTIARGGVRLENNVVLCYIDTVAWKRILNKDAEMTIDNNSKLIECPKCPGDGKHLREDGMENDLVCREFDGQRRCWNNKMCQKICPDRCKDNCVDENTCCNENCIGGCLANNLDACISCRDYSIYNSTCIKQCPSTYFSYLDRRCITAADCIGIRTKFENNKPQVIVPYDGKCSTRCPTGYNKIGTTCQACGDNCVNKCNGALIDSVERAKDFTGCTHIVKNGLTINIKRGGKHLMEELESGLASIQEITTFLKIQGTYGLTSLSFFKHLTRIAGAELAEDKFAIYALENNDLETIWGPNRTVIIERGRVFFHFNPKLCYNEIEKLLPMMRENATFDKNEVATDSNGHKGSCNTEVLNITTIRVSSRVVVAEIENPLIFDDNRTFIGYQYYYMEDKYQNATKVSQRVCDDSWMVSDPTKETKYIFSGLQPYTQYAYYVKTWTISSEKRNAQSAIQHFKTKSAQPNYVNTIRSYPISSSEIAITWQPPSNPQGNLITYRVHAYIDKGSQVMETRNYCKDPAQIDKEDNTKGITPDGLGGATEKPNATNCKCDGDRPNASGVDTSEATIVAGIDFENTLQNFIYVKRVDDTTKPSANGSGGDNAPFMDMDAPQRRRRRRHSEGEPEDSFLRRHMRAADDNFENLILKTTAEMDSSGDADVTTTITPLENSTLQPTNNSSNNETILDVTGQYYESFVQNVSVTFNKYVFQKLKHFTFYAFGVEACREPEFGATEKECSDMRMRFVRTKKLDGVDKVENLRVYLVPTNTTRSDVRVRWDPPINPNGDVVSYTISYKKSEQDAVEEKRCITEDFYRNLTNGYIMQLPTGNYSVRVRANSLAGDGTYSEIVYVDIPPEKWSTALIASLCAGIISAIMLIGGGYWYLRRKYAPPSEIKIIPTVNPYYISMQYVPDAWEVERDRVLQLSPLGQGSFGMVYEGILKSLVSSVPDTPCAIKTVNENATDRERINFLSEASVMKQFDTHHVVRLLGVCSIGQPALVVMELMKFGDLKSYLRAHRPDSVLNDETPFRYREAGVQPPPLSRVFRMAIEIGDGMAYLSAKKFVHRDLAARNCMVGSDLTVKIGDFGMTRDVYETDYYRKGDKGLLPVRWMPPESLRDGIYSTASDVFSYGVVLWEIVTLASQPYPGYSNDQVLRFVIEGGVMERPDNCADKIYEIMQQCWEHRPTKRPSFSKILRILLDHIQSDASDEEYIEHFHEVSFYFSEDGTREREKERAGTITTTADIFNEDNEIDDATTPLRTDEYKEYKSKLANASLGEHDDEMGDDDEHRHSPFSHSPASAKIVSSTPDGHSKKSYNISQKSHTNPTLLSSLPSTSTGIISGGSHSLSHFLHQPGSHLLPSRPKKFSYDEGSTANYILPDPDPSSVNSASNTITTDDRGYEMYDPSPNYREQVPYDVTHDDDDNGSIELSGSHRSRIGSGGQKLLPRSKPRHRMPTIRQMSSSAPDDEIIEAPFPSSLHPSTASAASSNASSLQPPTGGRYSSLRAVADKMQAMPKRLKNMNRRIFSHKRSGSNTSHKSTSSNPITSSSSNSNINTGTATGTSNNQNLSTIESGGSGSAASYVPAPRFFSPSTDVKDTISGTKPQYHLLDESANTSNLSTANADEETAGPHMQGALPTAGKMSYKRLDETLNVTASPAKLSSLPTDRLLAQQPTDYTRMGPVATGSVGDTMLNITNNPNYPLVNQPAATTAPIVQKAQQTPARSPLAQAQMNVDPAYTMMGPMSANASTKNEKQLSKPTRAHKNSADDDDDDGDYDNDESDDDDGEETEHIKMKLLGAHRRNSDKAQQQQQSQTRGSRSRSQSHNTADSDKSAASNIKSSLRPGSNVSSPTTTPSASGGQSSTDEGAIGYATIVPMAVGATSPSSPTHHHTPTSATTTTTTAQARPSSAFSLKENWLRQQQQSPQSQQQQAPPPPPNGFLGRDT